MKRQFCAGATIFMLAFLGSDQARAELVRYEYSGQLDASQLSGSLSRNVAFSGWFIYDPDEVQAILSGPGPPDTVMTTTLSQLTLQGVNEVGEPTGITLTDDSAVFEYSFTRKNMSIILCDNTNPNCDNTNPNDGATSSLNLLGASIPLPGVTSAERVFESVIFSFERFDAKFGNFGSGGCDDCEATAGFRSTPVAVPEPTTFALFGLGLASLGFARRRKSA